MSKFNNISELLEDEYFQKAVDKVLHEMWKKRADRPEAREGYKYPRDWYDRMSEKEQLRSDFMFTNFIPVLSKRSTLPSQQREIISRVYSTAMNNTVDHYRKEARKEEAV